MKTRIELQNPLTRLSGVALLLSLFLLLPMLACSISLTEDKDSKETKIAQNVQSTLNSEKVMTLEAQQTSDANAAQQTPADVGGIVQTSQATIDAQNTSVTATETPISVQTELINQPIVLLNWIPTGQWAEITNCPFEGICWTDSPVGNYGNKKETVIASTDSTFIDPAWVSPYLVFWMKLDLEPGYDKASVDIRTEENSLWKEISYFKNTLDWNEVHIALEEYTGQKAFFRFRLYSDDLLNKDGWYLQNIRVEPNYHP